MDSDDALPTLRALKYYSDSNGEQEGPRQPRNDVLIHFATRSASVTPAEPLAGDCLERATAYRAAPVVLAELRGGAVVRDGSFVLTGRNELLRESVDRLSSIAELSNARPNLVDELGRTALEPSPETVAVLGCQRIDNYFHWWIDVMAKLWVIQNSPYRACRLVTPPLTQDFQHESLRLLGQSVTPMTRPLHRFKRLVFARGLTYGSSQSIAPQVFEFAQWCRGKLGLSPRARHRKLFLSRRAARRRRLLNEDEVVAALGGDFERIELESLSFREEATLLSEASAVVAPHGAGLTNLLFCERPTAVVELVHEDAPPDTYRRFAGLLGHPYIAVGCEPEANARLKPGQRNMSASASDVSAAVARLKGLR